MASEPYTVSMITQALRDMSDAHLSVVKFTDFQTWPTRKIVPGKIIRELIINEKARRR